MAAINDWTVPEGFKEKIMRSLNTKWKENKYELYLDVADMETREARLASRPPHISIEDWSTMLDYWSSEAFMITENRDTPEPTRVDMYIQLHDKKSQKLWPLLSN